MSAAEAPSLPARQARIVRRGGFCLRTCLFLGLCLLLSLTGCKKRPTVTLAFPTNDSFTTLSLIKAHPVNPPGKVRFDASGLTLDLNQKTLLTVNDKLGTLALFSLTPGQQAWSAKSHWRPSGARPRPLKRGRRLRLDLEGVTACQGAYLVISEQFREVFRLSPGTRKWTRHPIALGRYRQQTRRRRPLPRFSLNRNAGYEGIACDQDAGRLFVVQERQPRFVLVLALPKRWHPGESLRVMTHFDLPSLTFPRRAGKVWMEPDFSGAAVHGGHLYLLYRNARVVQKVSLETYEQVAVASFRKVDAGLYRSLRPFGMAEGIAVSKDRIWILYDNNGRRRRNRAGDRRAVLLEFRRRGF